VNSNPANNLSENEIKSSKNAERRSASWDIKNTPRNYLSLIITQFAGSFFAFASVWLITKQINSEGYGSVVAILAASQIAQVLINWTSFAVVKFGTEEFIETEKIARIFWTRILVLVLNIALVLLASNLWFPPLASWLKISPELLWLVILHFVVSAFWIHIQYSLQGVKKQKLQGGLLAVERLLVFSGILFLWATHSLTPFSAVLFYISAPLLMVFVGCGFLHKYLFKRFSVNRGFLREIFVYSIPLLPFSLIGYFSTSYIDAVFISGFLSTKDLGIYSVATQINGLVMQVPTLANSLLIPMFITLQKENRIGLLNQFFEHTTPGITLIWGLVCSFAALTGWIFIPLVFGAGFASSVPSFWILLSASVLAMPSSIGYAALVHSSGNTYIATVVAVVSALVNVSANFALIPTYGLKGCAWATVFTYFASVLAFAMLLNKKVQMPVSWIYIAPLPSLIGAAVFTWLENPWIAIACNFSLTAVVIYLKWKSIVESFNVFGKMRNQTL
jgi:O-antigen/teichoic acid export membrane protein